MRLQLEPNSMYYAKGAIYKTNSDGVVDVENQEAVEFLKEYAGAKQHRQRQDKE